MEERPLKLLLRFLKFLRPYWKKAILAFFLMLLGVVLQLPMPFLSRYLIDRVIVLKDFSVLNLIGFVLVVVLLLRSASVFMERVLLASFRARVLYDVKLALFRHLQELPLGFFRDMETGYLMSRVSGDVDALQGLLANTAISFVQNSLTFAAGIACTLYIHPKLALISFSILPLYAVSLRVFNRRMRQLSYDVREKNADFQKVLQELISGISVVKAFSREVGATRRMAGSLKELVRKEVRLEVLSALAGVVSSLISSAGPLVLIWYGCGEIMRGNLTVGGLVAFNSFMRYLFGPTGALVNLNFSVQRSLAACRRVFEILDAVPEVEEGSEELETPTGEVEFRDVSFSYGSNGKVLDGVSFKVRPGEVVALVGESGVGKTTLVNLIPRFYDPQEGEVLVDGIDVRRLKLRSLRACIGMVPQDTFLFSTSIRENIRFARPGASDEEVEEAARLAHIHEFIESLPEGYDTEVGERGAKLSAGQRQRIAIARAVLRDPKILILDEATSNLDPESEGAISDALRDLMRDRTVLVIAHRPSTVVKADRIIALEKGRIAGQGRHEELLASCPAYRRLFTGPPQDRLTSAMYTAEGGRDVPLPSWLE